MRLTTVLSVAVLGTATLLGVPAAFAQQRPNTTTQIETDIIVPRRFDVDNANADTRQQARDNRQRELDKRCDLWRVYLGVARNAGRCEARDVLPDTGGDANRREITRGRLTVDVPVPTGRRVELVSVNSFTNQSRYDAWLDCHRAASSRRSPGFRCDDRDKNGDGLYVSELREVRFVGGPAQQTPPNQTTPPPQQQTPPQQSPPQQTPPPRQTPPTPPPKKSGGCSASGDGISALWIPMALFFVATTIRRRRSA